MMDTVLFVIFPYVAVTLAVVGGLYRYFKKRASSSGPSSQPLEDERVHWGAVIWYLGIIPTLLIHLSGFTIPKVLAIVHGTANLLYIAELIGKVLALFAFTGIILLLLRRLTQAGVRLITSPLDWVVLVLFLNQIFLGLWMAFFYRWGSAWYIHTATPWVASLATFQPQPDYVTSLPWVPKLHFLNATLLILLFPFSNLVHLLTFPFTYLWHLARKILGNKRTAH